MSAVDRAPRRAHGAARAELGDEPPRQAIAVVEQRYTQLSQSSL